MIKHGKRYDSVAISFHWIIALLIFGLMAIAKWMTGLPEADPLRFTLTQWHKSFGILVLVLSVLRLVWRLFHKSPSLPRDTKRWERFAAGATHLVLYLLIILVPLSGWIMVSVSPLNLKTVLFGMVPWPHLPITLSSVDPQVLANGSLELHHILANGLLAIALLHIAAALRHHFILRDDILRRMIIDRGHHRADNRHGLVYGLLLALGGGLYLFGSADFDTAVAPGAESSDVSQLVSTATVSEVGFTASQMGEPLNGAFTSASIELIFDGQNWDTAALAARVDTASASTGDVQIDGTLPTAD